MGRARNGTLGTEMGWARSGTGPKWPGPKWPARNGWARNGRARNGIDPIKGQVTSAVEYFLKLSHDKQTMHAAPISHSP